MFCLVLSVMQGVTASYLTVIKKERTDEVTSPLHPAMRFRVYHTFCIVSKAVRKNLMIDNQNINHKEAVLPEAEYLIQFYSEPDEFENMKESVVNHGIVKDIIDNVLRKNVLEYRHLNWLNKLKQSCDTAKLYPLPSNYGDYETYKELTDKHPEKIFMYLNMDWDENSAPIQLEGEKIVEVMNSDNSFELAIYRGLIGIINGVSPIRECVVCNKVFAISSKGKGNERKYCRRNCADKSYRQRKIKSNDKKE